MKLLVTHHSPDLDAIGAVWMLKTFAAQDFADAKVAFVDPGCTISEAEIMSQGMRPQDFEEIVHVDTGLGDFDHHQPDRGMQHICATSLTYDYCAQLHPELAHDAALQELVRIVTDIDHFEECFWPEANDARYAFMVHELLDGLQRAGIHTDETQLHFGMTCLNGVYKKLEEIEKAKEVMLGGQEFSTRWGKGIALETKNDTVIKYAQKAGYAVVIKRDPEQGHIRIKAVPKAGVDLTPLANRVMAEDPAATWYFHPAKTMLLNGSDKWKNKIATTLSLEQMVELVHETIR